MTLEPQNKLLKKPKKLVTVDNKKFAEMWTAGITGSEIAKELGISKQSVYPKRQHLGLPKRRKESTYSLKRWEYDRNRTIKAKLRIVECLKKHDGYASCSQLEKIVSMSTVRKMWRRNRLIRIKLCRGATTGDYKRHITNHIFKSVYAKKTYYCLNKTALIRLLRVALKKPATKELQRSLTVFLNKHLTAAEKFAVLWHLGIRSYAKTQVKSSIQIDGVVMPNKKFLEASH